MHRVAKDAGGVLVDLERRVGKLERNGRGFSIPPVETTGGTIASDNPPPAPSDPDILWIDTDDGNKIYRWNGSAWVPTMDPKVDLDRNMAATVLASWQDTAASGDGLVTLYRQSAAPGASGLALGDLWVDSDTNGLWRWSGSAWGDLGTTELGELLARSALSSTVADGRVRTWWQFNEPVPQGFGDVWVNTSATPSTLYRWNNFDWIQVLDWSVLDVQQELETKISTWYEPAPPTSRAIGDLWYDTANQLHPYRAEAVGATTIAAGQWVSVQDGAIQAASASAAAALDLADDALTAAQIAQAMADGVITTHYSDSPPWPAGSEQDPSKVGDLWLDTVSGQAYHWTGDDWLIVADNAVAAALIAAQNAQTTADGKINAYYLDDPPWANGDASHSEDDGDLWFDTNDGNKPHYWDGDSWESIQDQAIVTAQETADQSVYSYVIEYAVNSSETVPPAVGSPLWSTATPTRAPGTYVWFRTTITRNDGTSSTTSPALLTGNDGAQGDPGPQGVPGPTGANGQQLYTWIKYADTPTTGMADSPTGKAYLGLAYNKTTATESNTYSDYTWSLIKGADGEDGDPGVMGPPGPDGQPTYTWIKYGTSAAGAGLSDDPTGRAYIGIAYNKTTQVESTTAADYDWSLIQGPPGANAATVTLTATAQVLAVPAAGGATTPATAVVTGTPVGTTITSWQYSVNGAAFSNTVPPGASRAGNVVTITGSTMTARTIAVKMADAAGVADTLTVAKVSDGATGATGSQGIQGPAGANGQSLYTWIKYADTPTTGMADLPAGKTYMGIAYNKSSSTESSAYGDYEWSLIQGPEGDQGIQGPAGADGQPTYTWIKYGTSAAGAGLSDSPVGKTYIGIAYNKTTPTESSTATDYEWSLIQGPQGPAGPQGSQGIQGPTGADGQTLYTWLKYADSPTTGMSDSPVGKTYMGLAHNKTSSTESSTYGDYTWSLIQGTQGVQGPPGDDGQPTYTWIKYGDSAAGAGLSDSPAGKTYIGIAYNKTTATESSTPGDYEWSLIQGPQGQAGADAYTVLLTNESHSFPGSVSAAVAGSTTTQVLAFEGAVQQAATIGTVTGQVTGLTTTVQNNGTATAQVTVTVTTSLTALSGVLVIPVTVDGVVFTKRFSWSVSRAGSTGGTGPTGVSVTAITPFYAQVAEGAAAPAKPDAVATPPAPWVQAEPAYAAGTELYRTERVTFSNSTYSYTDVAKSSAYDAANAAMTVATTKNSVYRQDTRPWADGAGGHSDDVGDLWFDTSLGPGSAWEVVGRQLTSNVATLTTADPHDIQAGWTVSVIGVDPVFDGVYAVSTVGAYTVSYAKVNGNVGFTSMEQGQGAVVQGQGVGEPINKVFIWDGSVWNDARDAEVTAVTSTLNNQVSGQAEQIDAAQHAITALQQQAEDLALTAYAADGRINISDYEPLPDDAYQPGPGGEQIPKNEGSLWITRTRDRVNFITNPSFETNTTGWTVSSATMTRTAKTGAPDSGYAIRVVNNGTTSIHYVRTNPRYPVNPGQNVVGSGYVQLESGVGANYQMIAVFYDGVGTQIASGLGGVVYGQMNQLAADGTWTRLFVSAPVPDNAATVDLRFYSAGSNTADVWFVDAVLGEITDKLGRYFDGGSVGGSWVGTEEGSASELDGGAVIRLFELADGGWVEKYWTADTISSVSADTIIGDSSYKRPAELPDDTIDGALVADNSLAVDKMYAAYMTASEELKAGDLVNTWDNNGLFMVQRASAGLRNLVSNPSVETDLLGYTGNNANIARSTAWAADGSYSLSVAATGANDSFATVDGSTGAVRLGMRPGGTYTLSGHIKLSGALSGTLHTHSRKLLVFLRSPTVNSNNYYTVASSAAPNAAGDYRLSVTFTLADDATEAFVRLMNGSTGGVVYWDAIQLDESTTDLPYRGSDTLVREAHGFVLSDCAIGEPVRVYHGGYNELVVNQAPGQQFLSVLPGGAASSAPQDVGSMVQQVGFSPNPGVLNFTAGDPITIT